MKDKERWLKRPAATRGSRLAGLTPVLAIAIAIAALGCSDQQRQKSQEGGNEQRTTGRAFPQPGSPPEKAPPSLLLITLDTTRADALGAYGQSWPTSPRIDRLAAGGVLFEQVAAANPETLPSHATILTGKWPYTHGVRANAGYVLSERNLTLAEVLRGHGYRTGAEIAARVLRKKTLIAQGFDHYRGADSPGVKLKQIKFTQGQQRDFALHMRVGSDITAKGIDFLRENQDQKFFLWLHYFDPHDPYSAPAMFNKRIPESSYHAEVASADFQIGLLIDELERLGLREKTLVVLTSDHGEGLGEHGEPTHSYFVYDATMRVPLILWGLEDLPRGLRVASLVRTVDIAPTVLDLLGLPPMDEIDGVSLGPLLADQESDLSLTGYGEASRFSANFGLPMLRFVREGRWKYIHKVNPELYDVIADPAEQTNLASQHPDITARLRKRLEEMIRQAPPAPDDAQVTIDQETAEQLVALGYAARSPAAELADEMDSLALSGEDPVSKIGDTQLLSEAMGMVERKEFAQALERLTPVHDRNPDSVYVMRLLSRALLGLEQDDEAVAVLQQVLKREPCDEKTGDQLSRMLHERRRYAEMVSALAAGARHCPDALILQNNYAWALATLPDDELRDGARAVEVIRAVIAKLDEPDPAYLDTLAAALAETGDFEKALRIETEVLRTLRASGAPGEVLAELEHHLEAYRAQRAVRDPAATGS